MTKPTLIKVKISVSPPTFSPKKYTIEFWVESQEELDNLRKEFREGQFYSEHSTEYSTVLYDVVETLKETFK